VAAPQFVAFAVGFGFQDLNVDPGDRFHVWEIIFVAGLLGAIVLMCSTTPGDSHYLGPMLPRILKIFLQKDWS
jgi:hypothetical protein